MGNIIYKVRTVVLFLIVCVFALPGAAGAKKQYKPDVIPNTSSFIVADIDGTIIKEQNSEIVRPIASISKLLLAVLVTEQDPTELLAVPKKREVNSSIPISTNLLSRRELMILALVKSDNLAAVILCDNLPNCIDRMNTLAHNAGMIHTHFVEPTGLSKENVSTAQDLLKLILIAVRYQPITDLSSMPKAEIIIGKQLIRIKNTNPLTSKFNVVLSKTGFTDPAGGCLVMVMKSVDSQRVLILLGSKDGKSRIPDMERLVKER